MNEKYVVIDLETTGHSPVNPDKIIEVGVVTIENNEITEEFSTFLNPNRSIPSFITNLTGIADQDVHQAPFFRDKADEISALFENSYLVAHNVPFDLGFLNAEFAAAGFPELQNAVLDTVEIARILYPQAPGFKLGQLADHLNIGHDEPHRALTDAYMTAKLFLSLMKKLESLPYETITHLIRLETGLNSDLYTLLYKQQQALAFSSDTDESMDIYRGLAIKKMADAKSEKQYIDTSFGSYLDGIYEAEGTMKQLMAHYEKRPGQREMSETVFDAFQSKNHALIEAETGTGKSLAYLLPAIYEAVTSDKKIVISTFTTQLQSQLLDEEVPLIRQLVSFPFNVALLKGKQHYISLEKFERELAYDQNDNYDIILTKAMILVWLTETETGDVDEIQLPSSGYLFYRQISTDSESTVDPSSSPWFSRSYYQKARRKAQKADILITNHALLCTDMFNDYQLLPSYDKAIIDEAHHLEETASKHYGLTLHYVYIQTTLTQIGAVNDGNWVDKLLNAQPINDEDAFPEAEWNHIFENTKHEIDDLFRFLFQYVVEQKQKSKTLSDIGRIQYRFDESKEQPGHWTVIKEMVTRLTFYFRDLIHLLSLFQKQFETVKFNDNQYLEELTNHMEAIQSIIDRLERLFLIEADNTIKWIETEVYGAKNAVYLYSEPTDIATLLANDFFSQKESVILTSATLSIRNSFAFSQKRLGLSSGNLMTTKISSPFSYKDQVQLMIPNDFPDVRYADQDDFIYSTCEAIISLAEITDGRMLVLFTSYDMLRKSYYLLKDTIDINKYMLIAQGISSGSRSRLKKNFQTFDQSILLGTSSFWEGVDIPGEDLSCLMIVRLPFQPPNHPVYEAKSNALKNEGKNAFFELSLPNAVIRFKQGFGRLIRSINDRGIVFVCDARVMKARYGKYFTESIPDVPITHDSTQVIMEKAEEWF